MGGKSIIYGEEYQYMATWYYICEMLKEESNIEEIYIEYGEHKSFDDIVIQYKKTANYRFLKNVKKEYIQVKFHMKQSDHVSMENLMKPKFINAKSFSFLEKVAKAYQDSGKDFSNKVFTLYSPWTLKQGDVVEKLYQSTDALIDLKVLFNGTKSGKMFDLRKKLSKHMHVSSEEELKDMMASIRIKTTSAFIDLFERLNEKLEYLRLKPMSNEIVNNEYVSLIREWIMQETEILTKEFVLDELKKNNLIKEETREIKKLLVNNFPHDAKEFDQASDLSLYFDGNLGYHYLKEEFSWDKDISVALDEFIEKNIDFDKQCYIQFQAKYSIAFYVGKKTGSNTGRHVFPIQSTIEDTISWKVNFGDDTKYPLGSIKPEGEGNGDIDILILNITRFIEKDVNEYIEYMEWDIGKRYVYTVKDVGQVAIFNGTHAWQIVNYINREMESRSGKEKRKTLHVFVSAPVSFMFLLGQFSNLGRVRIYEYDKENTYKYSPGISFPIVK